MIERINCIKCIHFFVTHQPQNPYGCRAYGFKSKPMPSVIVQQSSGMPCGLFVEKTRPGGAQK